MLVHLVADYGTATGLCGGAATPGGTPPGSVPWGKSVVVGPNAGASASSRPRRCTRTRRRGRQPVPLTKVPDAPENRIVYATAYGNLKLSWSPLAASRRPSSEAGPSPTMGPASLPTSTRGCSSASPVSTRRDPGRPQVPVLARPSPAPSSNATAARRRSPGPTRPVLASSSHCRCWRGRQRDSGDAPKPEVFPARKGDTPAARSHRHKG